MSQHNRLIPALIIIVILAFAGGYLLGTYGPPRSSEIPDDTSRDSIAEAWDIILNDYVEQSRIDTANLSGAAIDGMLQVLDDPYSAYLNAEQFALGNSLLEGSYNGIGAYVTVDENEQIVIIAPIAGSPADKAGIKPGDVILEIDGEPIIDMSFAEAVIKIRGPKDTTVKLLVRHEGETEPVEIEVIRATFEVPSVRSEMRGETAYINITDFTERTPDELDGALQSAKDQQATGIVLDLRGNPGGLLDPVIEVASSFLTEGIVVKIRDNQGEVTTFRVQTERPKIYLPMVVLVDGASASGSEVLAGALQDHKRATIAGTKTYGKGSVNALYPLSDGSGLYITTARWLTPNDRLIEGQGIEPDIELEVTGEDAIQWAIDYLKNR